MPYARKILDANGLKSVKIKEISGNLTDHYDPRDKVVRLSTDVYHGTSIASVSVAAHEVGHVMQKKESFFLYNVRTAVVPVANKTCLSNMPL